MEYSYVERRAEILELIEQQGHPYGFDKSGLGRRDGVSEAQLRSDVHGMINNSLTAPGDIHLGKRPFA